MPFERRFTKRLNFAVSPQMFDRLEEIAKEREVGLSALLRQAVRTAFGSPTTPADMSANAGDD